jgi:hypothetical protein
VDVQDKGIIVACLIIHWVGEEPFNFFAVGAFPSNHFCFGNREGGNFRVDIADLAGWAIQIWHLDTKLLVFAA